MIDVAWWFYIIPIVMAIVTYCWFRGRNPISWFLDYRERKRLEEAARLGLTWEQYKEKHHIEG